MNTIHRPRLASASAVLLGAALLLSGCASNTPATPGSTAGASSSAQTTAPADTGAGGYGGTSASSMASSPVASAADLKTASTSLGNIVVDAKGMTLYFFTKDAKDTKTSACTGPCLDAWPLATTANATPSVDGVTGKVGTIQGPGGTKQITLNGMPLYYFAQDAKPGDVKGQGLQGAWYVATPAGEMVTK